MAVGIGPYCYGFSIEKQLKPDFQKEASYCWIQIIIAFKGRLSGF